MISVFTAFYNIFIIISVLIVVHELGHFLCGKVLGVEVEKIIIFPLGGISKFKMSLNISPLKEFLILIFGPLFQFMAYYLLLKCWPRYEKLISTYHYSILIFNLLPIYPLDGGKLVNLILSTGLSFKLSLKVTIVISYIVIATLVIINYNNIHLNLVVMTIFLVYKLVLEQKRIDYLYNKFLLERYLNKYKFKRLKIIYSKDDFFRNRRHLIREKGKYYLESEFLTQEYQKNQKIC